MASLALAQNKSLTSNERSYTMRNDFEIPSNFFSDETYRMEKDIDYSKMIKTILHEQKNNQIYGDKYETFSDHDWQYDI